MTKVKIDSSSRCYTRARTCLNDNSIHLALEPNCLSAALRQQNRCVVIVADQKSWYKYLGLMFSGEGKRSLAVSFPALQRGSLCA